LRCPLCIRKRTCAGPGPHSGIAIADECDVGGGACLLLAHSMRQSTDWDCTIRDCLPAHSADTLRTSHIGNPNTHLCPSPTPRTMGPRKLPLAVDRLEA
jgi:hypothetical protein